MKALRTYLADFTALLFPELCQACGTSLLAGEDLVCTDCIYNLPYTNFHLQADNIVARQFWGKLKIEGAYAMCYFTKGGRIQHLMHRFKYKNMPRIGNRLGALAGAQLIQADAFKQADIIIPIPLHKSRQRKRGYNQSICFAEGLALQLNIPVENNILIRTRKTETQTQKSRFDRAQNMMSVFKVIHPERLANKHVLLVDDVMTTGSTLEACGLALLCVEGVRLSIATIAYAL